MRPITQITDEKNNTIAITPKIPVPKIEERNLSGQLQSTFPDVHDNQDEQKIFEFEFFTGGTNQKFDSFVLKFGLSSENMEFLDFYSGIIIKKY